MQRLARRADIEFRLLLPQTVGMNCLEALLAAKGEGSVLVIDGAMGTELFARGLISGASPELWNVEHPDRVAAVHQAYVDAGSDIVLTNSFGGTTFRLKLHDLQDRSHELNKAAAAVAREVVDGADRKVLVAGSIGPTGELLEPMGELTRDGAVAAFTEQARGLADGGADLLWIETMSDLDEVELAIAGAKAACDLPIVTTLSFDTAGRTMMGVTGADAANRLIPLGIAAIGANCGNNLPHTEAALAEMRAVDPDVLIVSKGNAGMPVWAGDELSYSGTPEVMAAHAAHVRDHVGAAIIGSCCGSAPEHIAQMAQVLSGEAPVPEVDMAEITSVGAAPSNGEVRTRKRSGRRRA